MEDSNLPPIVGGLLTSTLAEFFVPLALFWTIDRPAGEQMVRDHRENMKDGQWTNE